MAQPAYRLSKELEATFANQLVNKEKKLNRKKVVDNMLHQADHYASRQEIIS